MHREANLKVHKTMMRLITIYRTVAWVMTKQTEIKLLQFVRKILERMYEPIQEEKY